MSRYSAAKLITFVTILTSHMAYAATTGPVATSLDTHKSKDAKTSIEKKTFKNPASSVKSLGAFGSWHAYQSQEQGHPLCYALSYSQKDTITHKHQKNYMMVTHRPANRTFNVISINMGYTLTLNHKITLSLSTPDNIKGKDQANKKQGPVAKKINNFLFITEGQTAWATDEAMDDAIIKALSHASTLVIKDSAVAKGEVTYALYGISKALHAINKACKAPLN